MRSPAISPSRHPATATLAATLALALRRCERDFAFTWSCLNATVERTSMLATFVRCVLDKSTLKEARMAQSKYEYDRKP